jgi:5'-deoxynucleotidase YfbR-like HD superfamily hydrolase
MDGDGRLERQLRFLLEIDELKGVLRRTVILDRSRQENSAEHSWHLAMMAVVLAEHATEEGIDLARVLKMVLVHDVVEIDAGDTYAYDEEGMKDKAEREERAAERLFGLLPADQGAELRGLWDEFEARQSAEARFANALDRLQPILLNYHTEGLAWARHGVRGQQVLDRNHLIGDSSPALWEHVRKLVDEAVAAGWLGR